MTAHPLGLDVELGASVTVHDHPLVDEANGRTCDLMEVALLASVQPVRQGGQAGSANERQREPVTDGVPPCAWRALGGVIGKACGDASPLAVHELMSLPLAVNHYTAELTQPVAVMDGEGHVRLGVSLPVKVEHCHHSSVIGVSVQ